MGSWGRGRRVSTQTGTKGLLRQWNFQQREVRVQVRRRESTACVKISSISLSAEWKQILRDGTDQEWGYEGNVTLRIFEFSPNVHADFCFRSISDGSDKARSMRGKVASPEGRRPQRQEIGLPWGGALGKRQQGRGQTQKIFRSKSGQILWQTVCEREMDYGRKKGKEAKRVG